MQVAERTGGRTGWGSSAEATPWVLGEPLSLINSPSILSPEPISWPSHVLGQAGLGLNLGTPGPRGPSQHPLCAGDSAEHCTQWAFSFLSRSGREDRPECPG